MQNLSGIAKQLITTAKKQNIYLVIRFQNAISRHINIKNEKVDKYEHNQLKGTGIHTFTKSGHMGFASVDSMSNQKRIISCLDDAIAAAKTAEKNDFESSKEIFAQKPVKDIVRLKPKINPFKRSKQEFQKDVLSFNADLKKLYPKFSISNSVGFTKDIRRIFRSDGTDVKTNIANAKLSTQVVIQKGKKTFEVYQSSFKPGYELLKNKTLETHKKQLATKISYVQGAKNAKPLKPGNYPILLGGEIAGVFMHEAFGHTAESDNYYQGSPLLKDGKMEKGRTVAKVFVNVYDYAQKSDRGFTPYSDWGIKREKAEIVKQGKVNSLISDVLTAKKTNSILTGGARAQTYKDIPVPRMSKTYIELDRKHTLSLKFDHSTSEVAKVHEALKQNNIFDKYEQVIYLFGTGGGQADTTKGNFQFGSIASFAITKDKVLQVKPVSFSGSTIEALHSVELAFGEPVTWPGSCGKWGQNVPVSVESPMLLLEPNKSIIIG